MWSRGQYPGFVTPKRAEVHWIQVCLCGGFLPMGKDQQKKTK